MNAGSDTLSVFAVNRTSLRLLHVVPSGGGFPTSVAIHDKLLYVMNAGDDGPISGFSSDNDRVTPIADRCARLPCERNPPAF